MTTPTLEEQIKMGLICAHCKVEYDHPHGKPILCWRCHNETGVQIRSGYPKAWLEEKTL
jgi:hypothetical protein